MDSPHGAAMTLRLELFVEDIAASKAFYTRILNFTAGETHGDGYTPLSNGQVVLSLNRHAALPADHPVRRAPYERPGRGIELVLEVAEIDALYAHVCAQEWPLATPLQQQPWGLRDFRLVDPDGYYLRLTSRRNSTGGTECRAKLRSAAPPLPPSF